jgi:Uma2 family endonuclease
MEMKIQLNLEMVFPTMLKGDFIERMSDEEFFHFCQQNRDVKVERDADGKIIIMSPTHFLTGKRNNEILYQLTHWNKRFLLGECVDSDTGFTLRNGAVRNPDAAWISNEQLSKLSPKQLQSFPHICPAFIVELKSKSDSLPDLKLKMKEWTANGCRLGWLIDADEEVVYIFTEKSESIHDDFDKPISGGNVLLNFQLILSELRS